MKKFFYLVHRICHGLMSRMRNFYYRALGVRSKGYVWMRAIEIPRNWDEITLEHEVALDHGVSLVCSGPARRKGDKLVIRAGTYVNRFTIFDAHEHIEVGRNCMIGPHCYITDGDHGTAGDQSVKSQPMVKAPVIIEDEVWLGANVVILPGVHIGKGAVVGAGSVVTHDISSHVVAMGAPAKAVRTRE